MSSRHTAKTLFDKNIKSAGDCIALYKSIEPLAPSTVNVKWILRAAVMFTVSALDTYFHDQIKYQVGKYSLSNMPIALGKFEIKLIDLIKWDNAERKGNVIRNFVTDNLSKVPLQSQRSIADAFKLIGVDGFWDKVEPNNKNKEKLLKIFNGLVKRRHQISHEGDRLTARSSGKELRSINIKDVEEWVRFAEDLVGRVESFTLNKKKET